MAGHRMEIVSRDGNLPLSFSSLAAAAAGHRDFSANGDASPPSLTLRRAGGLTTPLFWDESRHALFTEEPETDVIAAMRQLAASLDADVRGRFVGAPESPRGRARPSLASPSRPAILLRPFLFPLAVIALLFLVNQTWLWPKPSFIHSAPPSPESSVIASSAPSAPAEVLFIPLGDFDFRYTAQLARETHQATGLRIRTLPPLTLPWLEPYPGKTQFDAMQIVSRLERDLQVARLTYGQGTVVLFTTLDINQGEAPLNFVFAHHDRAQRISVISSHRLARGYGVAFAGENLIRRRFLKFCLRTLGEQHYDLPRSDDRKSVMFSPIHSLADVDSMGWDFPAGPKD